MGNQLQKLDKALKYIPPIAAAHFKNYVAESWQSLSTNEQKLVEARLELIASTLEMKYGQLCERGIYPVSLLHTFPNDHRKTLATSCEKIMETLAAFELYSLKEMEQRALIPTASSHVLKDKNILIFTCSFGNGHKTCAEGVTQMFTAKGGKAKTVDLSTGLFLPYDPVHIFTNFFKGKFAFKLNSSVAVFNWILTNKQYWIDNLLHYTDSFWRKATGTHGKQGVAPWYNPHETSNRKDEVRKIVAEAKPNLIVTTYHMDLNLIMSVSRELNIPVLHIPTDFDPKTREVFDYLDTNIDQKVVQFKCTLPTSCPATRENAAPLPSTCIVEGVGIPLRPGFYQKMSTYETREFKRKYHIAQDEKVLLLMSGGNGQRMEQPFLLANSNVWNKPLRVIIVAGKNQELVKELQGKLTSVHGDAHLLQGSNKNVTIQILTSSNKQSPYFVNDMLLSQVMDITDVAFTKAGGVSCAELLHKGVFCLFDKAHQPFSWENFNINLAVNAGFGGVSKRLTQFENDLADSINKPKQALNPFHFPNASDKLIGSIQGLMAKENDRKITMHTDICEFIESCLLEGKRLGFSIGTETPIVSKSQRKLFFHSIDLKQVLDIISWMHRELDSLRQQHPATHPLQISSGLNHLAILLKAYLKRTNFKDAEGASKARNLLLKVFLNIAEEDTILENHPDFADFMWKSQWYLLAPKFNHKFSTTDNDIILHCKNEKISWSELKKKRHADGKLWIENNSLNGVTIVETGLIVHDAYHSLNSVPHKTIANMNGFAVEIIAVTKKKRTIMQQSDHAWIRLYNNGAVYSFGRYGTDKINFLEPLNLSAGWSCDNYDRYERFTFSPHLWDVHSKLIDITEDTFKKMLHFINDSKANNHQGSYSAGNCSHFVEDVLKFGNVNITFTRKKVSSTVWESFPKRIRRISDSLVPKAIAKIVSTIIQIISGLILMIAGHFKAESKKYSRLKTIKRILLNPNSVTLLTPKSISEAIS